MSYYEENSSKSQSKAIEQSTNSTSSRNVLLETSMGNIEIELYWKHAPNTCKNFYELSKRGYYNKTIFHRIVKVTLFLCCIYLFIFLFIFNILALSLHERFAFFFAHLFLLFSSLFIIQTHKKKQMLINKV